MDGHFFKEDINYRKQHLILIQTLPTSSTRTPPKPHANDPIANSGFTGNYLDELTTKVNTMDTSEDPIKVKLPN